MSQPELLKKALRFLDASGISYMVTGSVVSSYQGEPRSTHDIDLVIDSSPADAEKFIREFKEPQYYIDRDSIAEAIKQQGMFNLMDISEGDKIDFWLLTNDAFDQSRFSRRRVEEAIGIRMYVSSPEDTILMKLKWAGLSGGSEKQFTDALRVYEVQFKTLDLRYLQKWAIKLGLESALKRLEREAEII
jgi:hypothetical protein